VVSVDIPRPDEGRSAKVFLPRASVDRARLGRVELGWDASVTPHVGVWVCNGDLGGYRQIAIEPATDSPLLVPGESLGWVFRIAPLD
ncbi:MAG TPA: hypothetical protein VJQ08_09715, partial [Candidatus Dormibacteraeota bacterium]|nr:hypothetical protein [Candidatus Dormibacteraeota bacterium]